MRTNFDKILQADKEEIRGKTSKWPAKHRKRYLILLRRLVFIITIFVLGAGVGYLYFTKTQPDDLTGAITETRKAEKDTYIEFLSEVYDKIKENYWDNITDVQLSNLFKLGAEKLAGPQPTLSSSDKKGLGLLWSEILKGLDKSKKKEFSVQLASLVLSSLNPPGRNGLYTEQKEKELQNMVHNINPDKDLYADLGLEKNASQEEIEQSYRQKLAQLEKEGSPEAKQKIKELDYAYEALKDEETKQKYDEQGVEPTVLGELIRPKIFHIHITRFSPTTFDEFQKAVGSVDNMKGLDTLILDLRGNIGGSIDILPYFLGPFIGQNQYAYEFFRKGETVSFKTKTGWLSSLVRYKKVVVLVDGLTQSTAELMAATLKKYNVGVVVGTRTLGWGTVEKVYQLDNQINPSEIYSVFLVNHLTLRDDGQPIEGQGVDPVININDADWEKQLYTYFRYPELIEAVKEIWKQEAD